MRTAAAGGDRLHHAVVDRRLGQPREDLAEQFRVFGQPRDRGVRRRQQQPELLEQGRRSPDEHAGVPPVLTAGQVALRDLAGRLLREVEHVVRAGEVVEGLAAVQVAVAGVRAGRHDTQGDQRGGVRFCDGEGGLQAGCEHVDGFDHLVGGDLGDDGFRVLQGQHGRRPGDGVQGVPADRLAQDVGCRQLGQVGGNGVGVGGPGHHQHALGGDGGQRSLEGQPQQALAVDQRQQLLGGALTGQGPQPGAGTTGHDHYVAHGSSFPHQF